MLKPKEVKHSIKKIILKQNISSKHTNSLSLSTNTYFDFKLHQHTTFRTQWNNFSFPFLFLFLFEWSTFANFAHSFHLVSLFHIISNHNFMKYQQVYALVIFGQEKRKTYKKLRLTT